MVRVAAWGLTFVLVLGSAIRPAESQSGAQNVTGSAPSVPEISVGSVLRNLASRSAVIFVGQVTRIEPQAGTVEVTFQVQQAVLGNAGTTYTLREWSGLWAGGQSRYRLGQRAMIFLHAPKTVAGSAAGLSSPVDGMDGVVPLIVQGADTTALLDVRWLAARVLRTPGAPLADADSGAMTLADGIAVATGWKNLAPPEPIQRPLPIGVRPVQPGQSTGIGSPQHPEPVVATTSVASIQAVGIAERDGDSMPVSSGGGSHADR